VVPHEVRDVDALLTIIRYLAANVGNLVMRHRDCSDVSPGQSVNSTSMTERNVYMDGAVGHYCRTLDGILRALS